MSFPGGASIDLSDDTRFALDTAGTFAAWMNYVPNANGYLQSANSILGRNTNNHDYGYSFGPRGTAGYFETTLGLAGSSYQQYSNEMELTGWMHVAATFSASSDEFRFYVNGELVQTEAFTAESLIHPACNTYIGKFRGSGGDCNCQYFTGTLDEIGIWSRALNATEIMQLHQASVNLGCTDETACNYDAAADVNDGTCEFGCLHCGPGTHWNAGSQLCVADLLACGWNPDANADAVIGVSDLLALLSVYGDTDLDGDGIMDSLDECVGSFDACGVCNGEGVDLDADGLCDDLDPCVGQIDSCGICNGEGAFWQVIDEITLTYDSVFIEQISEWYVFLASSDTSYVYTCPPSGCMEESAPNFDPDAVVDDGSCLLGSCEFPNIPGETCDDGEGSTFNDIWDDTGCNCLGTPAVEANGSGPCAGASTISYFGVEYDLVEIESACWFAQNLATGQYRNGESIPDAESIDVWNQANSDQCVWMNDEGFEPQWGRLYNWWTVHDERGVCPVGWHVANQGDVSNLVEAIGGSFNAGQLLLASSEEAFTGTNSLGWNGHPAGHRSNGGDFLEPTTATFWWVFEAVEGYFGQAMHINANSWLGMPSGYGKRHGFSVRCVAD